MASAGGQPGPSDPLAIAKGDWIKSLECDREDCTVGRYSRARDGDDIVELCKSHLAEHLGVSVVRLPGAMDVKGAGEA